MMNPGGALQLWGGGPAPEEGTADDDYMFSLSDGFKSGTVTHVLGQISRHTSATAGELTDEFRPLS